MVTVRPPVTILTTKIQVIMIKDPVLVVTKAPAVIKAQVVIKAQIKATVQVLPIIKVVKEDKLTAALGIIQDLVVTVLLAIIQARIMVVADSVQIPTGITNIINSEGIPSIWTSPGMCYDD